MVSSGGSNRGSHEGRRAASSSRRTCGVRGRFPTNRDAFAHGDSHRAADGNSLGNARSDSPTDAHADRMRMHFDANIHAYPRANSDAETYAYADDHADCDSLH